MAKSFRKRRVILCIIRIALVTAASGGKENAMTVAWHMPMSKDPPLISFVTGTSHFTYKLIKESREFAINLMPTPMPKW